MSRCHRLRDAEVPVLHGTVIALPGLRIGAGRSIFADAIVFEKRGTAMATYDLTRFRASPNSYSGGKRGSLEQQLNAKVSGAWSSTSTTMTSRRGGRTARTVWPIPDRS
jgi:hypothetical protein